MAKAYSKRIKVSSCSLGRCMGGEAGVRCLGGKLYLWARKGRALQRLRYTSLGGKVDLSLSGREEGENGGLTLGHGTLYVG